MLTAEELKPGRDLDVIIAEKIFNWEWWKSSATGRRSLFAPGRIPRCPDEWFKERATGFEGLVGDWDRVKIPKFSTKIKPALKIVQVLRECSAWCCIDIHSDYHYVWTVRLTPAEGKDAEGYEHKPKISITDESLPMAICKAALAAFNCR